MTPRERDPQVWAAAYGAAFVGAYLDAVTAVDGQGDERTERAIADVHVGRCTRLADAAVMALHTSDGSGHSTRAYPNGTITRAAEYGETER